MLAEIASSKNRHTLPAERILPSNAEAVSKATARSYYARIKPSPNSTLTDEMVVTDNTATLRGSNARLMLAIQKTKKGTLDQVPSFGS